MHRRFLFNELKNKKHFLLVRHGQSIWNHDSKFTGWTNIPLTLKGKEEAKNIAHSLNKNNLRPNIIFSSVLHRAMSTSNIIKNELSETNNVDIHTSWRLNEKHYGTLEGVPRQFIRNIYGEKFTSMLRGSFNMKPPIISKHDINEIKIKDENNVYRFNKNNLYPVYKNCYFEKIKNGESKENVLDRLLPYFQNDICYTFQENKFPLIVTHKHCARVLMKHLLNMNDEEFEHYDLPSKKILYVELNDDLTCKEHLFLSY